MDKAERKYLAHYLDANPLGETPVTNATNYIRLGKDLEEYNEALNPDVTTTKNILGENNVTHNGFDVSSDVDPFYVYLDSSGNPDDLAEKIAYIANNRMTNTGCKTTKVDVLVNASGTVLWAYREEVLVVPNSVGGNTSGVQIPFTLHNCGERVSGTWDASTKTFTPASSTSSSSSGSGGSGSSGTGTG